MANQHSLHHQGQYDRILYAGIIYVDPAKGTCSIQFLDQIGARHDVPIPVIGHSRNAWMRFMPQVNDIVAVGLRGDDTAYIIGWVPYNYDLHVDNYNKGLDNAAGAEGPELMRQIDPGEIDMQSAGKAYFCLDNLGDVLLMSMSGHIHMIGKEGSIEAQAPSLKLTDGKSSFRFGANYRQFYGVNDRDVAANGVGLPSASSTPYRECDIRLYDADGNLLVQESKGNVMDDVGILETSGTSGGGENLSPTSIVQNKDGTIGPAPGFEEVGSAASSLADIPGDVMSTVVDGIGKIADHVVEAYSSIITTVTTSVTAVTTTLGAIVTNPKIAIAPATLQGILTGVGFLSSGADAISGIGVIGNELRYRLRINKKGKQVAAFDIDEDGTLVLSSQSVYGMNINANKGSLGLFASLAFRCAAKIIQLTSTIMSLTSGIDMQLTAGNDMLQIAGAELVQTANKIERAAVTTIKDVALTSITLQVGTSSVTVTPGSVAVSATLITLN